ncbi:MAG: mycothiol synthase [Actinobacteria bacterium]|nr:mycothiol synthase [Actinomycetota bacterium]
MSKVEVRSHLDRAEVLDVFDLVDDATRHDGITPLSEHVMLHLRHGGDDDVRHLLARNDAGRLVGYAHLDVTDLVEGPSAETVVAPADRRHGLGHALIEELIRVSGRDAPGLGLRLWAHGESAAATGLAEGLGFTRARVLWQMRRSLMSPLPDVALPAGLRMRTFLPGIDDTAWLEVNAAAFAHLPDQGGWTQADLDRRKAESWFDPSGFLVATDSDDQIAGFHWTKVHGGDHPHGHDDHARLHAEGVDHSHGHGHEPLGEVYVIGVAPTWQGTGLGRALLVAGLRLLAARGLPAAMLYVDAANTPAIGLYSSLGFTHWDTDVLYRHA